MTILSSLVAVDTLVVVFLFYHVVLKDHVLKSHVDEILGEGTPRGKSPDSAKFGGHRQCNSSNIFLVAEEEDSGCCRFNPSLLFISKGYGMKACGTYY